MRNTTYLFLLLLLGACSAEPETAPAPGDEYSLSFVAPIGADKLAKTIEIERIGDTAERIRVPGCRREDADSEQGSLTTYTCAMSLSAGTPGEFTTILGFVIPGEFPGVPSWISEGAFTRTPAGRGMLPPYGDLDVFKNGLHTETRFLSGAPSWDEEVKYTPDYFAPTVWDVTSPCPKRFPYRDDQGTCAFLRPVDR